MGSYSPHVSLGFVFPIKSVSLLFDILNGVWIRNIIYLAVLIVMFPSNLLNKILRHFKELLLKIKNAYVFKNFLISFIIGVIFGILFFLATYRFYFDINSYTSDEITLDFLILRNIVLIIIPTIFGLYSSLTYSSRTFGVIIFNILAIIAVLLFSFNGFRPHQIGFFYVLFILISTFITFDGFKWLFFRKNYNANQELKIPLKSFSIFSISTFSIFIILILSWPGLHKGTSKQFNQNFETVSRDYKNFSPGRFPDLISIQPPRNGFNYGQNFIYKTTFDLPRNIKSGKMFLVSEDHHKIIINGNNLEIQYGTLYYARHGSKRKSYDFGIHEIDLSLFLKNGTNELTIWNNLSASVYPTGIAIKLHIELNDGQQITIKSDDMKWALYEGILDKDMLREGSLINYEMKDKDMISMSNHFIHKKYINSCLKSMDFKLIEPQIPKGDLPFLSIELWIFILFSILGIIYMLILFKPFNNTKMRHS